MHHRRMFGAILEYGWENIRHYILFENLDEETAHCTEATLIENWKTYNPKIGYNSTRYDTTTFRDFTLQPFTKMKIDDSYDEHVLCRLEKRRGQSRRCKSVRVVETGEIFSSVIEAASKFLVSPKQLYGVVGNPNRTCGYCTVSDPDEGWSMIVRAHWEYVI